MENQELMLTSVSVAAGFLGLFLACFSTTSAGSSREDRLEASEASTTQFVATSIRDELYASLFQLNRWLKVPQQFFGRVLIRHDRCTVNNAASEARHVSDNVRHMQSGNLRSYAGWIAAGAGRDRPTCLDGVR